MVNQSGIKSISRIKKKQPITSITKPATVRPVSLGLLNLLLAGGQHASIIELIESVVDLTEEERENLSLVM